MIRIPTDAKELGSTVDNIYYDVAINNPISAVDWLAATYVENRDQPILKTPSDYYMSVIRFSLEATSIPLFIFPITDVSANPLLSPLSITLSYSGNDYKEFVIYQPRDLSVTPTTPYSVYYYVYEYHHMLDMINVALSTAFTALKAANPGAPPTQAPYFTYDASTQLLSLFAQQSYAGANTISIYINTRMTKFLNAFENIYYSANSITGKDIQLLVKDNKNNTPASPASYYQMQQEFKMFYLWDSVSKITFTSSIIPARKEYIPAGTTQYSTGVNATRPIITDFVPSRELAGDIRSNLIYNPTGPYRLIDMLGNTPLNKFDLQIWWEDHEQNLYPFYIIPGSCATVKILFVKRSLYKVSSSS